MPRPQHWYDVPLGRTGVVLSNPANTYDGLVGVHVYVFGRLGGDFVLDQLLAERQVIEDTVGMPPEWNPDPENRDKVIGIYRDAHLSDRNGWEKHLKWMVDTTRKFRSVFGPRVWGMDVSTSINVQRPTSDETS